MKINILDETTLILTNKRIKSNRLILFLAILLYICLIILLFIIDNRSIYLYISIIMGLITTLLIGLFIYILVFRNKPLKQYSYIILRSLYGEKEKYQGNVVEISNCTKNINQVVCYKILTKDNKNIDLYIKADSYHRLDLNKKYRFDVYENFISSYEEINEYEKE